MTDVTHDSRPTTTPRLQPALHELVSLVAAPALLLTVRDGGCEAGGVTGLYVGDTRLLDVVRWTAEGTELELVRSAERGAARHETSFVARGLGDRLPDPTVRLDLVRELDPAGFTDRLLLESVADEPVEAVLHLDLRCDDLPVAQVKQGHRGEAVAAHPVPGGLGWDGGAHLTTVVSEQPDAGRVEVDPEAGRLTWRTTLRRGDRQALVVRASTTRRAQFGSGFEAGEGWRLVVEADDRRIERLVERSLADLRALLLQDEPDDGPGEAFLAAGSPWFLTLFGRDSLWAARMLVPVDPQLALSTLAVLARRQGTTTDPATEEEPGKILHEVRPAELDLGAQRLPPLYYGSIDATPLFVCTLADAADWGADRDAVRALLPAARRCLEWLLAASEQSGWLRYVDQLGHGLSNQGWKDSHDSVQFADGRLAEAPIALCEVQAYAFEAAVRGAALLAAHDEPPVPGLAAWAESLASRFTDAFWVPTPEGGHVAIALDGEGRRADSVTSNLGHLLGTGLLDAAATDRLAALLGDPRLDSGFGLRTLGADSPRFSRLSYHGGTVWPHDTAVAVRGLAAEGHLEVAASLTRGLVDAAEHVAYRLPELFGGDAAAEVDRPSAYPASCRPQAWAAAAPIACLLALTGVRVQDGVVRHPARTSSALGAFTLRGVRAGGALLDVAVDRDGAVEVSVVAGTIEVRGPGAE